MILRIVILCALLLPSFARAQDEPFLPELETITAENAHRLEQLAMIGRGYTGEVAWSPDGSILAVASTTGIWLYDANDWDADPQLLATFDHIEHFPDGSFGPFVEFSPDGRTLAFSGGDVVQLWDMVENRELPALDFLDSITGVTFSPDGLHLVISGYSISSSDFTLSLSFWNTETWEFEKQWDSPEINGYTTFENPTFSPDGRMLAVTGNYAGELHLFDPDAATYEEGLIARLGTSPYDEIVTSIAFSPDMERIATTDGSAEFYSVDALKQEDFIEAGAVSIAYSPDGRLLATATTGWAHPLGYFGPTRVTLYDANNGQFIINWKNQEEVRYLSFSPDSRTLVAVNGASGVVKLWDTISQRELGTLQQAVDPYELLFSPDGRHIGLTTPRFTFEGAGLIDLQTGYTLNSPSFPEGGGWRASTFTPTGDFLVAQVLDNKIELTNITHDQEMLLDQSNGENIVLTFSPDGSLLASNGDHLHIWDTTTGALLADVEAVGITQNTQARFSPDSQIIYLTEGPDGERFLRFRNARTGEVLSSLEPNGDYHFYSEPIAFQPGNDLIAITTSPVGDVNTIIVANVNDGTLVESLSFTGSFRPFDPTILFTDIGNELIFGSATGEVHIWNADDWSIRATFESSGQARIISASPDGLLLAIGNYDGSFTLWDYATLENVGAFQADAISLQNLIFNSDTTLIATSGFDGTVRLWGVRAP